MHVSFLCQNGYTIHKGIDKQITLYKWISRRSVLVPPYSSFYISCGAVLINKGKILLVQEKNGARKG